ncbi:MAG TPA: O-antigen ligase family protein, partial [Polyangiaceae bacterium]
MSSGPGVALEVPANAAPRASRRRRRQPQQRRREQAGLALFAGALVVPAVLFGGQPTPVLIVSALLAAGAAVLLAPRAGVFPRVGWLVLALTAYTALQLLPLPWSVVNVLSPGSAAIWAEVLRPFGEAPLRWVTLSMDPGATAIELLKAFAYVCVLLAARGAAKRGASSIPLLLFGSALLVAFITLVHGALDIQRVYGLYQQLSAGRWTRGPFVNGNNLAGYLNLGLFAGAGLWLSERSRVPRWIPALGIPVLAASLVLGGSRGGAATLMLGAVIFVAVALRRRDAAAVRIVGGTVLIAVLSGVALLAFGSDQVVAELSDRSVGGKVRLWGWALGLARDFPVFGVGRGGFETAFPPYRGPSDYEWASVYTHAENVLVDWVVEWGLPVTLGAIIGFALLLRPALGRIRGDSRSAGVLIGLGALLVQSVVDFGLELYAVAAAALVAYSTAEEVDDTRRPSRVQTLIGPVGVVLASLLVLVLGANPLQIERRKLREEIVALGARPSPQALAGAKQDLRGAMLRHPGEPYFAQLGAVIASRERRDPLPWLARALERGPRLGSVHYELAQLLHAHGRRGQALMHL